MLRGHFFHPHNPQAVPVVSIAKLSNHRLVRRGDDDVVPVKDGKGLAAHKALGAKHRVAQPLGLLLADILDVGHLGDVDNLAVKRLLAGAKQPLLQLRGPVEVILHAGFSTAGDNKDIGDARPHRLLHNVVDGGAVHNGEHLLGDRFGGGEDTGAQPGGGNHSFCHIHSKKPSLFWLMITGKGSWP